MQRNKVILPPQTIGIIGGGQLGRMMAIAAREMGYQIAVLDPTPNCPTAQIADHHIQAAYDDMDAIQQLTELSDVVTYEFENVDLKAAKYIEAQGKLPQGALALEITQNREKEKQLMKQSGLSVPNFAIVHNANECQETMNELSYPAVIKTCRGGYDGKGQLKIRTQKDLPDAMRFADQHQHCIIEEWIPFDKEISVVFTRTAAGNITIFPIGENEHKDHILYQTTVPAQISDTVREKAIKSATTLAHHMNIVGTFAIEMFVKNEDIYINEMAPRPHNSGHYTIEACNISQFKQHILSICDLPLVDIELLQPAVMINILGEDINRLLNIMPKMKHGFVHLYGKKEAKEKRKMGHVTFIAEDLEKLNEQIDQFKEAITYD